MAKKRRVEIKITGYVQGVFFRYGAKAEAERLGLTGFAKNEPDGSVTVVAEGEENNLQKLAEWCKNGTKYSRVEQVEARWREAEGGFSNFEIR